jgi:hypothetical protein
MAALYFYGATMKLYQNTFDKKTSKSHKELLCEDESVATLKGKGQEIAQLRDEPEATWFSEPIMGEKKLDSSSKWYMFLNDEIVLTISE